MEWKIILDRMLKRIPDEYDKSEGSFFYDALAPAAIELAQAYTQVATNLQLGFAESTSGKYLDYRSHEHGLQRKAAVKAIGQVTITGTRGTIIPAGALFATSGGVQFQTTKELTIDEFGQVEVNVEAVEAGTSGNVPAAAINTIPVSIAGVTEVTNSSPPTGGMDTETDEALLIRLLTKVREPATSGNANHYKQWAMEVTGIGDAKVFPIWNGAGTVKVLVINSNKQPASTELVQDVYKHIESVRPIGATVTVTAATGVAINIATTLILETDYTLEQVQPVIEAVITNYLKSLAFVRDSVSYAIIGSLILDIDGVADYSEYTINGATTNIAIGDQEVAVLGTMVILT